MRPSSNYQLSTGICPVAVPPPLTRFWNKRIAAERVVLTAIGTLADHSDDELDAMLASNPYASPEIFDDDKYTRCSHV